MQTKTFKPLIWLVASGTCRTLRRKKTWITATDHVPQKTGYRIPHHEAWVPGNKSWFFYIYITAIVAWGGLHPTSTIGFWCTRSCGFQPHKPSHVHPKEISPNRTRPKSSPPKFRPKNPLCQETWNQIRNRAARCRSIRGRTGRSGCCGGSAATTAIAGANSNGFEFTSGQKVDNYSVLSHVLPTRCPGDFKQHQQHSLTTERIWWKSRHWALKLSSRLPWEPTHLHF